MKTSTKSSCVQYACIAKGGIVLAEFNSRDSDLAALAEKCLEKKPHNHEIFSHTVRGKTYTFLIDENLVYFAIYIDSLEKAEGIAFLRRVKESFDKFKVDRLITASTAALCFQDEFSPIFHELLPPPVTRKKQSRHNRSESLDSMGKNFGSRLFLGGDYSSSLMVKKTKKRSGLVDEAEDVLDDDSNIVAQGLMLRRGDAGQRERRREWRKHVWFVLSMDVIICCILFAVWLWI